MKKLLKWIAYSAAGLILLATLIAGITQTQFFRDKLRSFALNQLDSLLTAEAYLGEVQGNLITGFAIDSVSLKVQGEEFVYADRLEIRYDLFQIPSKRINVGKLTLIHPRITLLRGRDSVWNFAHMVRPTPDDTAAKPFDWPIAVGRFEIRGGTFRLVDSATLAERDHIRDDAYFVEYHDFAADSLNMVVTSAFVSPSVKRMKISSLSFVSESPEFQLRQFSGEFSVTQRSATVKNMKLQSGRSNLLLNASLDDVDLFGGFDLADLKSKPVDISLRSTNLDFGELKRFLHQVDFLEGSANCEIVADGEFGKLQVRQLDLLFRNSEMHFAGQVSHLDDPERLLLNVKCRASKVDYADVLALIPSFNLPDFSGIGIADVEFDFDGEPLDFATNFSLRSEAGSLSTKGATLLIGGRETLRYKGEILAENLQLAPILQNRKLDGTLNGTFSIDGYGTSLEKLNGTFHALLDSSELAGIRVGASQIALTASNNSFDGVLNLSLGSMRSQLQAGLNRSDPARPTFRVDGRVSSLNLAEFLHDDSEDSDITLNIKAEGTGLEWDKLSGTATLDLSSSRYKEYYIESSSVDLSIDQQDPLHSNITMKSEVADFAISGQFDLDYMVGLISYEVDNLSLAIGRRFRSLDSTLATSLDEDRVAASGQRLASLDKVLNAEYELVVKDLEPLSILTGNRTFDAIGTIKGSLNGTYENLEGVANLHLREFFYGNADSGMLVQDGEASLWFNDLRPANPLSELTLRVQIDAGKMHINRTKLDTLNLGIFYDKEYAGFVLQADYDRDLHLKTNGQVGVTDDGVQFTLSRLLAAYKDFSWKADDGAIIAVTSNGMRVHQVTFRRDTQMVRINGFLLTGGALDVALEGKRLNLEQLRYLLSAEEHRGVVRAFEGIADLDVHASGTLQAPLYDAKLRAQQVFYRGFPFGEINGTIDYRDEELSATLLIDNRTDRSVGLPDLTVRGVLPINLALQGVDERFPSKQMDFTVYTDGLQMSLLDPLVPTFNELTGILKADFKVGGTPKRPNFTGSMSIANCSFLFVPNNMYYRLDGEFQPAGERIKVLTTTVRNIESDNRPGREGIINITGDFALSELVPSDFNFDIAGQLLVVNKNTRTSSLGVYGELPVEARQGLHFSGNLQHTLLKGQVLVRNSGLAFPPTTTTAEEDTFYIPFKIVDDTTKAVDSTSGMSRYFASVLRSREGAFSNGEVRTRSFIDGLRYDLNVEFAGSNNEVRMIFNPSTNEELVANITGEVAITGDGKSWIGTLDVSRASYNFYGKRFDAEGTIIYTGDFMNPELDIVATYKGTRRYSDASSEENVIVTYKITGTRLAPKPAISMTIDGVDYYAYKNPNAPTSNDVQSDALTFIITNNFPLSRGERNNIAEQVGPTVGAGLVGGATSLLTSTLAEFLRNKTGFINSFEFRYDRSGSFGQSADVRLGGTAFKGYWRYGGKILEDPFSNANFSILYSFGDIFDKPLLRNFMVELERKVDTLTLFGSVEARKEITSARFFYRFSF